MKFLIFTDNHFCSSSSIIRDRGHMFSKRLENQIETINWLEELAMSEHCDEVICLGDFFDKSVLNDEELTALSCITWNNLPHTFIVGNHESSVNGLVYNSTKALEGPNHLVVATPSRRIDATTGLDLCFLPYIIESDRKPLIEYFPKCEFTKTKIIFSHNDIKGIQMGPIISKDGFDIKDIEENCNLFLNGHLHNGTQFSFKGINLGNVTGQNFGEDAFKYRHSVAILDTDSMTLEYVDNPYAFNFYKLEMNTKSDFSVLDKINDNSVLSIKCKEDLIEDLKSELEKHKHKIVTHRIVTYRDSVDICKEINSDELRVEDHLAKFVEFCKSHIDNDVVLDEELSEICK